VVATERDEPQTVIGSSMHEIAFPDNFKKFAEEEGRQLKDAHEHVGRDIGTTIAGFVRNRPDILGVQVRGEYAYAACAEQGLKVFDIAFIDHKGFSERITTAPVSPAGQRFFVKTAYATAVASPTTIAPDPTRTHRPENREQSVHAMYGYLYVADKYEGMITVPAATIIDGNPLNNFLERDVTFNPGNILKGANSITIFGTYAYITCDAGLVVVSVDDPKKPVVTSVVGEGFLNHPRAFQGQFRYGYVCDEEGIKVLDVTNPAMPRPLGALPLEDAHSIYLARTYAYVAAGKNGLVILDIERPDAPRVDQVFNAGGVHQRPPRREAGDHLRQRVRLSRRRQEWDEDRPAHLAGDPGQRRIQPSSDAPAHRHLQDPQGRRGAGDLQGDGPRPGGRRERQPGLGLRTGRGQAVRPPATAKAVSPRGGRPALVGQRRPARSGLRPGPTLREGRTAPLISIRI